MLFVGSYLGGDKFQVKADRDVHAKERRQSYGSLAPPAVSDTFILFQPNQLIPSTQVNATLSAESVDENAPATATETEEK